MPTVIVISGPVGAGKSTVACALVSLLPGLVSKIDGDTFWSFIAKSQNRERREDFHVIMRAMTAAAIPFVRAGFDVVIDFTIPPQFLETARKILKDAPLDYVVLRPSETVCAARAAARSIGAIPDYSKYLGLYHLFDGFESHTICDDEADARSIAARIRAGLNDGKFRAP